MSARPQSPQTLSRIPAIGELVNGKYRVEGMAGVGGMGIVLSAKHEELGHRVAIKVLASDEETNSDAVERFLREGRVVASLQSDHVVRIYDIGKLESGVPYMVMELLRGQDLSTYLSTSGVIAPEQAVDWILQAISAIGEAHDCGIIHRDLKPANLFLTQRSDGTDCVKVLDFGISKRIAVADPAQYQGSLTTTRQVVGSPAYMSPEQVRNARDIDHRVDIWALGMTLYELLTGRTAFDADTFPAVCAAIVTDTPPPLRAFEAAIPQRLEQIVLTCLEKDPTKRFASVSALANELRPFGSPIAASTARAIPTVPNSAAASGADSSTLISPQTPSQKRKKFSANVVGGDVISDRTMNSLGLESKQLTGSQVVTLPSYTVKRLTWLLLILTGFSAMAIWKVKFSRPVAQEATVKPQKSPESTVAHERFSIAFESTPAGANVWDGTELVGTTPFALQLDRAGVSVSFKKFVFKLDGYEPFLAIQGDSTHNVVIRATFKQLAAPSSATSPNPSSPQRKASRITGLSKSGSAPANRFPATTVDPPPTDIRSQR